MYEPQEKTKVGVLRGGPSPEYEVSFATGQHVLENLPREHYEPFDILISKNGEWHEQGMVKSPERILNKLDVVWNGLHGTYGEDGEVQTILEHQHLPFTGPDSFAAALSMNKAASRKIYAKAGLKIPFGIHLEGGDLSRAKIREVYEMVPAPFVVKPVSAGSSVGIQIVHSLHELEEAILFALNFSPAVLVEEFVSGKEATCGVIDDFREHNIYPLMPVEIRHGNHFFDYHSKYDSAETQEICPGNFSFRDKKLIEEMAIAAHRELGLRHYSRSDFIVSPKRGIFILETNSLPGLTRKSLLPKALEAAGAKMSEFLHHVISLALNQRSK